MSQTSIAQPRTIRSLLPDWPLLIWMVVVTLTIGLAAGLEADTLVEVYNSGFGKALGEFALILLPSFLLAAAMDRQSAKPPASAAVAASPLAGAGMICPDTAYAALSPVAGTRRLDVAFGSYAGFKLLYPAGPLIVATGLGVPHDSLLIYGVALLIPLWAVGALWGRIVSVSEKPNTSPPAGATSIGAAIWTFAPFLLLAGLLVAGSAIDFSTMPLLDFLTKPKGALLTAAALALASLAACDRRDCLDSAVRRTGSLLLVIGVASAFGAVLMNVVTIESLLPAGSGMMGVIGLFMLTVVFKLAQGSSMASFASVAPVAAPLVAGMDVPAVAAVFAICVGSFVAILPNDSFYWLVRRDALAGHNDTAATSILAGGAIVQAATGLVLILLAMAVGLL